MIDITPVVTMALSSGLVVIIVGVVEAIKQALNMPSRLAPLLAIVLGVLAVGLLEGFAGMSIFQGIVAGLAASGLYSGARATAGL